MDVYYISTFPCIFVCKNIRVANFKGKRVVNVVKAMDERRI